MLNIISIKEMQIQATMGYHLIPIKRAKIKRLTIPSVGEDIEQLELSCTAGENTNWQNHLGTQFQFL